MRLFLPPTLLFLFLFTGNTVAQPVLTLSPVITGMTQPLQVVNAGDNTGRIFIVQKGGVIKVFDKGYNLLDTFLTVTGITSSGERGLLSLCFHPDYATNGFFFVYYTNISGNLELARYKVSVDPNVADAASRVIVKTIIHSVGNGNNNGGELHFGLDRLLYLSIGDGGITGDTDNNAQNTTVLLGKILRFDVNTSATAPYYTVPVDNPFGNEVFAYGLRNPYRWSFDRLNNDMWIGDVGLSSFEEIDHRRYDSAKGANFGWRCYEGNSAFNTSACGAVSNYIFPVLTYPNPAGSPNSAVTGGTVYRGETYLALQNYYIAADFFSGTFYKIKYDSVTHTYDTSSQTIAPTGISDFGETEDGELYATCLNNGNVYRVTANGPVQYTFTGNGNWDVAANWSNNAIPPATLPAGNAIAIRPAANGECVLNVQQNIPSGTKLTIENSKQFRINGNLVVQ